MAKLKKVRVKKTAPLPGWDKPALGRDWDTCDPILKAPHGTDVGFVQASRVHEFPVTSWPVGPEHEKFTRPAKLAMAACHQENLDAAPYVCEDGVSWNDPTGSGQALDAVAEEVFRPTSKLPLTRWQRLKNIYREAYILLTDIMNGITT